MFLLSDFSVVCAVACFMSTRLLLRRLDGLLKCLFHVKRQSDSKIVCGSVVFGRVWSSFDRSVLSECTNRNIPTQRMYYVLVTSYEYEVRVTSYILVRN